MLGEGEIDKTKLQLKQLYVGLTATNPIVNNHQNAFALEILLFRNMFVENSMKFVSFVEPYFGIENETQAELTQNVAILEKLVQCHSL